MSCVWSPAGVLHILTRCVLVCLWEICCLPWWMEGCVGGVPVTTGCVLSFCKVHSCPHWGPTKRVGQNKLHWWCLHWSSMGRDPKPELTQMCRKGDLTRCGWVELSVANLARKPCIVLVPTGAYVFMLWVGMWRWGKWCLPPLFLEGSPCDPCLSRHALRLVSLPPICPSCFSNCCFYVVATWAVCPIPPHPPVCFKGRNSAS